MIRISALGVLAALIAAPAFANGETEKCFDKGAGRYFDCPEPAPAPAPAPVVVEPVDESGFYLGLAGGYAYLMETDFDFGAANVENEYDAGYAIYGQIGYEWDDLFAPRVDFRLDIEAGYMSWDVDNHTVAGAPAVGGSFGDTTALTFMTNAYVDYNLTERLDIFVGGCAGVAFVDFDNHGTGATGTVMNDDDAAFVFHLDAGLSYDITDNIIIDARYRFISAPSVDLTATNGTSSSTDVSSHQGLVGLRLKF